MFPYIADKSRWPHKPDVQYHENWPVRHPNLLFAGQAFERPDFIDVGRTLCCPAAPPSDLTVSAIAVK